MGFMHKLASIGLLSGLILLAGCALTTSSNVDANTIRVGYFANITHAQALVGLKDGTFQQQLGDNVEIVPMTFNAGPAEIEALFANEIDIGYVGPSPAINGYVQSQGQSLKIIAGAMSGGAELVLQPDLAAAFATAGAEALHGKKIASPQLGNTQDISLRTYLVDHHLTDVQVVPIANADQLTLFADGDLDGAWAPEPWAARLVAEANGVIALDERDLWEDGEFATTIVIARSEFIEQHPDLVQAWINGHLAVTDWMIANPIAAQNIVNQEIGVITEKTLTEDVLATAWSRLTPQTALPKESIQAFTDRAVQLDYLDTSGIPMDSIYDESFLSGATVN